MTGDAPREVTGAVAVGGAILATCGVPELGHWP